MALVKCKECQHDISKKAKTCPHCGARRKRGIGPVPSLIIIGLFVWFLIASNKEEQAQKTAAFVEENFTTTWEYATYPDDMGRGEVSEARIQSKNKVEFDFPYRGPQRAILVVRKHPKYGNDIALRIEQGQFLCRLDGCGVSVKFGEKKPEMFAAGGPDDHSTTALFIKDYDRFLKQLKNSDIVRIEAPFFKEGNRVFEFHTKGISWK